MAADHLWDRDFQIHPPSQNFTSAYLTCSLGNSLLNTLTLRGVTVYSNGPCMQGSLSRPGGGGETNVAPHSPGQNQVYSPWNCLHASYSFSQLLTHIFWKHASFPQNSKHKSQNHSHKMQNPLYLLQNATLLSKQCYVTSKGYFVF